MKLTKVRKYGVDINPPPLVLNSNTPRPKLSQSSNHKPHCVDWYYFLAINFTPVATEMFQTEDLVEARPVLSERGGLVISVICPLTPSDVCFCLGFDSDEVPLSASSLTATRQKYLCIFVRKLSISSQ